jgi:phage shock protein PspC (stress-responsive transcriptional regulator)
MKKTISINIGGINFHIDEDGYQKLKDYLEAVNKYFSTFEDSPEIIEDIESRIAEIFSKKLNGGQQTITLADVEQLIATMGTTADFEASMDADETSSASSKSTQANKEEYAEEQSTAGPKRLYRDLSRKAIGGVASGLANYLSIDPLWVRLVFAAFFVNFFIAGLSGLTFLIYVIMWIALPGNADLQENKRVKKLFRSGSSRVIGGVCSGIAAYFGVDVAIVRLLFVIALFFGGGVLLYIILWIITPEAKSLTEKMQMEGKPVTLKNIEENIKQTLNEKDGEERPFVKVLLFPFRLIATIFSGLSRVLGPILKFTVDAIRIAFGAIILFLSVSFIATLFGISIGTYNFTNVYGDFNFNGVNMPLELIKQTLDPWMMVGLFLVAFIPALAMGLLGLSIIVNKSITPSYAKWSLFAVWILAIFFSISTIPKFIGGFSAEGIHTTELNYASTPATPVLRLNDVGNDPFESVEIRIKGHADSTYLAEIKVYSRGENNEEATENAQNITYEVKQKGEDFIFDSNLDLAKQKKYRFQNAKVTFYVPYGKTFKMDEALAEKIQNNIHTYGKDVENQDWSFTEKDGLRCGTCSLSYNDEDEDENSSYNVGESRSYAGKEEMDYPFENFSELKIGALFDVEIRKSPYDTYEVMVRGEKEDLDEVYINQVGKRLEVRFNNKDWKKLTEKNMGRVQLIINMPELNELSIEGASKGEITGFDQESMSVEVSGITNIYMNVKVNNLTVDVDGASKVDLKGSGNVLNAEIDGASKLNSMDYKAKVVNVETDGASSAKVYADEMLNVSADGMSNVKYRGNAKVNKEVDGMSSVKED